MRRTTITLALLALLAALAAAPGQAAAKAPRGFFGIVSDDSFANGGAYAQAQFSAQAALGFSVVRQTFDWSQIETAPGVYNFSIYDQFVGDAARAGLNVLPIIFHAPAFRGGAGPSGAIYPPTRYADLGDFGAVLVKRYGPDGTFWSQNPGVPRLPIRDWQIWNEPNLKAYWKRPDPKQYAALLKAAAKPIKAADRGAQIVTAGMPQSRIGVSLKKFIPGMYKAGAARSFDILGVNPYGKSAKAVIKNMTAVRKIMHQFHDTAPMWATELGWSDKGPSSPQRVGAKGQATQLSKLVSLSLKNRRKLKLHGIVYFGWRDEPPYAGGPDFWGLHTGLLTVDGQPKPAYDAVKQALAAAGA